MKTTDIGFKRFPSDFYANNTFICGTTDTFLDIASIQLSKLQAENRIVLVTDPYLFPERSDSIYQSDLITLLSSLKAKKIIYCAKAKRNDLFYQQAYTELQEKGIVLEFKKIDDFHDRFWYCPESGKCVIFGTSLNGIGRKVCRIDMLTDEETEVLKNYCVCVGILTIGDSSGA